MEELIIKVVLWSLGIMNTLSIVDDRCEGNNVIYIGNSHMPVGESALINSIGLHKLSNTSIGGDRHLTETSNIHIGKDLPSKKIKKK